MSLQLEKMTPGLLVAGAETGDPEMLVMDGETSLLGDFLRKIVTEE